MSIIYFFSVGMGIIASVLLLISFQKHRSKFPKEWKTTTSLKKFRISVFFLMIYLICVLLSESISTYVASHHSKNNYIFSIYYTVSTPFLFGFLFIYTSKPWKRFSYLALYLILITYLISIGDYDPESNYSNTTSLLSYFIYSSAALLQLTDLLIPPKSDHFNFQLKFNLTFLIWSLLAIVIHFIFLQDPRSIFDLFYYLNLIIMTAFYLFLSVILMTELLKSLRS